MRKIESFLKPWQVSKYLGIEIDKVYELLESDDLPGTKINGSWRIRRSKLEEWLDVEVTKEDLVELSKHIEGIDEEDVKEFVDNIDEESSE